MKIIADTNIIISALINPNGKEIDIILNPKYTYKKYSCYFAFIEILKHKDKILKISKMEENDFLELSYRIMRKIQFINEEQIPLEIWKKADEALFNIDKNDSSFLALALFLNGFLWTGDKKLIEGLTQKGFQNLKKTQDLLHTEII